MISLKLKIKWVIFMSLVISESTDAFTSVEGVHVFDLLRCQLEIEHADVLLDTVLV